MLPFRSGGSWIRGASAAILVSRILSDTAAGADPTATPAKAESKLKSAIAPGGVPLPIGHEAKGIVLPDYDLQGRLQARFEAAIAKRIDGERIQFTGLKMTTFRPETSAPDLNIDMPSSVLDLTTRVITSQERTTITRADFNITGDTMRFDTAARQGTLTGNVKMVITDQSHLMGKTGE